MTENEEPPPTPPTVAGRLRSSSNRIRSSSISLAADILNFNPQPGMWAATGTAIAYAPTLEELREPFSGGANIEFTEHGHSARTVVTDESGPRLIGRRGSSVRRGSNATVLNRFPTSNGEEEGGGGERVKREETIKEETGTGREEKPSLKEMTKASEEEKHGWGMAILHGLQAFWKFFKTPTGFLMTVYGLNIVAWGAVSCSLFCLILRYCFRRVHLMFALVGGFDVSGIFRHSEHYFSFSHLLSLLIHSY
jgi:hypothetical protein